MPRPVKAMLPVLTALLPSLLCCALFVLQSAKVAAAERPPNVVLVMTDDQGYGDLGCHGNPVIETPALDRLYGESVRLTDYHVDPTCSPTRSALLTGRYSSRTGVWHTIMGRSILHKDETTLADVFAEAGYRTGCFGKWHLGDNYPYQPQHRGFDEVLAHGGGGVGQTPDYWGNDYFDDTYFHNGEPKPYDGYCTDIWFDGALEFIKANRDRPFFCYIPTNAAHGPFNVAEKYSRPYKEQGVPSPRAEFYGMITNIDENVARMREKLDEWGLNENTIFIFTTDNGTAAGTRGEGGYNAGMRATKGSVYDGGHRVPFFIHWPEGGLTGGRDIDRLTAHIDVLPTLAELCGLELPEDTQIDGTSLVPLLKDPAADWPRRTLFVHSQRVEHPRKWRQAAVMTDRWRLVTHGDRRELFDMRADPGQQHNVAEEHSDVFRRLSRAYEDWYADIGDRFDGYVRIPLGAAEAGPVHLTCHDWHEPTRGVPWNQGHIRRGKRSNGFWAVDVVRDGRYRITLRNRPHYVGRPLKAETARVAVGDAEAETKVEPGSTGASLAVELDAGPGRLRTWLENEDGSSRGAYFVDVEYLEQ